MFDKEMREPINAEEIMVVTFREVIEGTIFHNQNLRLSDALNAEAHQHSRYVALKNATVYSIATRRQILKTAFLLVSHAQVIYMTPKSSVSAADEAVPAVIAAGKSVIEAARAALEPVKVAAAPPLAEKSSVDMVASAQGDSEHHPHAQSYHDLLTKLTEMRSHGPEKRVPVS